VLVPIYRQKGTAAGIRNAIRFFLGVDVTSVSAFHGTTLILGESELGVDWELGPILAARFGFQVPPGYTFVRPHERGDGEKDVVYRSRSALQSLYVAASEWSKKDEIPEWFAFERDMRRVLESFGLEIQHVVSSQAGDHGIDVYATNDDEREGARWLIHCKASAPKEKVRPATVRALIEARAAHPPGTRGMLIATCSYTAASRALAAEHQIRVIDGFELSRLLAAL
jgi:hypothetical protein